MLTIEQLESNKKKFQETNLKYGILTNELQNFLGDDFYTAPATTTLATAAVAAASSMPAGPSNSDEPTGKNGKLSNSELKLSMNNLKRDLQVKNNIHY